MLMTEISVCVTGAAHEEQHRFLGYTDTVHAYQSAQSNMSHY